MRGRRVRRLALGTAVIAAVLSAQVTPAPALAGLRALDCCANTCHRADPVRAAKQCCAKPQASHPATFTPPSPPEPPLLAIAALVSSPSFAGLRTPVDARDGARLRAGPLFLLTGSLRL